MSENTEVREVSEELRKFLAEIYLSLESVPDGVCTVQELWDKAELRVLSRMLGWLAPPREAMRYVVWCFRQADGLLVDDVCRRALALCEQELVLADVADVARAAERVAMWREYRDVVAVCLSRGYTAAQYYALCLLDSLMSSDILLATDYATLLVNFWAVEQAIEGVAAEEREAVARAATLACTTRQAEWIRENIKPDFSSYSR